MKILVTGAAGFIGFHLTKILTAEGYQVIGIDNLNSYYEVNLKLARLREIGFSAVEFNAGQLVQSILSPSLRFARMDITNSEDIDQLFAIEKFDCVCHLAAQAGVRYSLENPASYIQSNIVGFFNMLEACRKYPPLHFIFASSSSVYGHNTKFPYSEKDRTDAPVSLYAASKKSGELMAHAYSKLYGLTVSGLRFFTVYGPWGRPDMAPMLFMKSILENTPIKIYNHGNLMRDFTYIDDIVQGITQLIRTPRTGKPYRIYNLGASSPVALLDFIETIEAITQKTAIKTMQDMQPADVYKTYANISLAKEDFNYSPCTDLFEGLSKLYEWYMEYNK